MTDLVVTRVFDAPRPMVYRAFVDPDQLAAWFGPVGWSVSRDSISIEAKPGGHQRLTMVNDADPEQRSPVNATFVEVIENELLVGEEDVSQIAGFESGTMRMRIEFHDEPGDKTRVVLTQGPFSDQWASGATEGWKSSFTKLDAVLAAA
jgi:uncharacterized protein YndB with AHSA1/START domain